MTETRLGKAWEEQYAAGMSSKEARAFKRGWDAAINMLADHFDTPGLVGFGYKSVTVYNSREEYEAGKPRAKDLTVWMRDQLSDAPMVGSSVIETESSEIILDELTPRQAFVLIAAWQAEQARVRNEGEKLVSEAEQNAHVRDERIEAAVVRGIPREQVERFVYSGPIVLDDSKGEVK